MKNFDSRLKRLEKIAKDLYKDARNFGIPKGKLASDSYVEAVVYLISEQVMNLYDCQTKRVPWYPRDEEKFNWARREVEKHAIERGDTSSLDEDEWPNPGDIPQPPREKTEEELIEERAKAWKRLKELEKSKPGTETFGDALNLALAQAMVEMLGGPPPEEMDRE